MIGLLVIGLVFTGSPCGVKYPEAQYPYCHNTKYESPLRKSDSNTIYETDSLKDRLGVLKDKLGITK